MSDSRNSSKGIKSNETLFSLIEYLRENGEAGVTELAREVGMAKSTVHGHLTSLLDRGYVTKRDGKYYLGLQFFMDGHYARNQHEIYEKGKSAVDSLSKEIGETAWLLTEQNGRVMYLYGRGGQTDINVDSVLGSWTHMHQNSGGKAILAHLPSSDVERILNEHRLPKQTENTITDREELQTELKRIRERKYALNIGEDVEGINAVGVPLVHDNAVYGAITIAGPSYRVTKELCETEYADKLLAAINDIELALTYE